MRPHLGLRTLAVVAAIAVLAGRSDALRADQESSDGCLDVTDESTLELGGSLTALSAGDDDTKTPKHPRRNKVADKDGSSKKPTTGGSKPGKDGQSSKKNGSSSSKDKDLKPLPGKTIDFEYDAKDVKIPSRAYTGRVFVHERIVDKDRPMPLIVFMHGLNKARIKFRWIGGGDEGDVRRIVSELIDGGKIPPVLLAAPTSTEPDAVGEGASFPVFDFDNFMALTKKSLEGVGTIDESRVIVAGHSGAGCSTQGGIVAPFKSKLVPSSILSIDTCMGVDLAKSLASAPPTTNIVVTWETVSWDRNFKAFKKAFGDTLETHPAKDGVLRELDALPALPRAHDATVGQTFTKYLPQLLQ